MGISFQGRTPSEIWGDMLQISNNNQGVDSTLRAVSDGQGNDSPLNLSTLTTRIKANTDGQVFDVCNAAGNVLFSVNTSTNQIIAGSGVSFAGDGSLLTGVTPSGVGGTSATVNLELISDSDNNGTGDIILKIGTKEVGRIPQSYAASLPAGVAGNYFLKTVADGWANPIGGAILNGVNQYYSHPNTNALNFGTGDFTYEFFGELNSANFYTTYNKTLYKKINATNGLWVYLYNNSLYVKINTNSYSVLLSTLGITATDYYHIVITRNDTSLLIYVNGVLKSTITISSGLDISNTEIATFYGDGTAGRYLRTKQIFSRFYNYALSQTEITEHWNNGLPHLYINPYSTRDASNTELVTNGGFDTDTNWGKGAGWSIANGVAHCDGTQEANSNLYQNINTIQGKTYKITYTISNYVSGSLNTNIGGYNVSEYKTANGTYTDIITADKATVGNLYFTANADFIGDVDNVSVIQLGETFSANPSDAGTNGWKVKVNGIISVMNSVNNPAAVSRNWDGRQGISTTETVMTYSQPANTILKGFWVIEKGGVANTVTIGTASGGTDIANAVAVTANSTKFIEVNQLSLTRRNFYVKAGAGTIDILAEYKEI